MKTETTVALPKPSVWSEMKISGLLAYAAVWAFFIIFLIYPLIRLFYDSFTTEAGVFTIVEFSGFLHRCLLPEIPDELPDPGRGHRDHHLHHRHRHRVSPAAVRFSRPGALLVSDDHPDDHAPPGRRHGFRLHPGPRRNRQHHPPGLFRLSASDQLHVRTPRGAPGGDAASFSADDALHRRRHGEDIALPGRGGRERRVPGDPQVLGHHLPADHPRLRFRGAPGLHLDLRRFRHAAGGRNLRPACLPGLSEHRPVRGPAALQDGDRHFGHHGDPGHPVSDHRQEVRVDQGLQLPLLFGDRAEEALPPGAGGGDRLPDRSS